MRRRAAHPLPFFIAEVTGDPAALALVRRMGADGRLSADHMMVRDNRAILAANRRDLEVLRQMGLTVKVGPNLLAQARRVRAAVVRRRVAFVEADGLLTGFVNQYLDTAGVLARFQALHDEFPALTEWSDLPHPTSGYDGAQASLAGPATVKLFRITTTPVSVAKPGLLLIAGIHAREWIPPLAAIEFAEQLLRTYTPGSPNPGVQAINALVDELDIFIVPAANPDGINFSHHDFAMWRKNRRANPPPGGPCPVDTFDDNGVDNNRNYSIFWGDAGSSGDVCNDSFRGAAAFSEPENKNVRHVIEQFPNILVAVDCHSFGEDIFRAHPTGGLFIASEPVEPRDHAIFLTLEAAMNAAIASVSPGKTYSTGTTNNHAGTGDDYLFLAHRIFGFTLECAQQFQPPIADALVAVAEVAAALRALAGQTLSLSTQFTFPVDVVHVVDRSGSMAAFGYLDPTKANVRRMIDLMSLNDTVAVVSFNQAATTHLARSPIINPGVYAQARSAVDAIAAGGFTSIGAGLHAAGNELAGAAGPKAILLLSDGYENRAPFVADVLPTLSTDIRVHTIALGPHSDQALLDTIATATGGQYYFSPGELELHEIYNFVRADASDEELALNETLPPASIESTDAAITRPIVVDEGATFARVVVSWDDPVVDLRVTLRPPEGPILDLGRVRRTDGRGYRALHLRRPQGGVWSLRVQRVRGAAPISCTVAAFLRSELRLRLVPDAKAFIVGRPIGVLVHVADREGVVERLRGDSLVAAPAGSLGTLVRDWHRPLPSIPAAELTARDALPKPVLQALRIRERVRQETKRDPLRHVQVAGQFRSPAPIEPDADPRPGAVVTHTTTAVPGTYNLKVRVQGHAPGGGSAFVRVGLRSLRVS